MNWAALVPELTVLDLEKSLAFYTDLLEFEALFSRPEARFAYLGLGDAQLMLDQYSEGQGWRETGRLEPPFGRGINLQIEVETLEPILARLEGATHPLFIHPKQTGIARTMCCTATASFWCKTQTAICSASANI